MESSNNPQMSSLAQPPQVMDTSAVRSSVAPAVDPFRTTSMPEPKLPVRVVVQANVLDCFHSFVFNFSFAKSSIGNVKTLSCNYQLWLVKKSM